MGGKRYGRRAPSRHARENIERANEKFWLSMPEKPQPTWPPFCPLDPEERHSAARDAVGNFLRWRMHR